MTQSEMNDSHADVLNACSQLIRLGVTDGDQSPSNVTIGDSLLQVIDFARDQLVLWPVCQGLLKAAKTLPEEQAISLIANGIITEIDNQARRTRDQIVELGSALNAVDIDPIFVKGAAFIVEAGMNPQPWRPMCDLDFLVEPSEVDQVVSVAKTLGYQAVHARYSAKHDVHFPMLLRPPDVVGLEPHTKLTWAVLPKFFSPDEFRKNSVRVDAGEFRLRIPSDSHRMAHLVVHAQISGHRYDRYEFVLRDLLDCLVLSRRPSVDMDQLETQFVAAGYGEHFRAFASFCDHFWQDAMEHTADCGCRRADQWRVNTLRGLVDPRFYNRALLRSWLRIIGRAIFSPREAGRLFRSLGEARRPDQIRQVFRGMFSRKLRPIRLPRT